MSITLETWTLPAALAPAFIDGDFDGLTNDEIATVEYVGALAGFCVGCTRESDDNHPGMLRYHDVYERLAYAAPCALFTFQKHGGLNYD